MSQMKRRDVLKLSVLSPLVLFPTTNVAFFQGLIIRVVFGKIYQAVAKHFVKKVVRRKLSTRILSVPSNSSKQLTVRSRSYSGTVQTSNKEKKIIQIINRLDAARKVAQGVAEGYKYWNKSGDNTASIIIANPSEKDISADSTSINLNSSNGEMLKAELGNFSIPAGGIVTTEININNSGFNARSIEVDSIVFEGRATKILERLDYPRPARPEASPESNIIGYGTGRASEIYEEYLGKD